MTSIITLYKAAEDLHHRYLTGLILRTIVMRGTADAAELVFRLFRRQQQEKFLPGIEKLGLSHLPDAVKCAQYHYLSNFLGDVNVEYVYESDRKAWVRYPPPRWIWDGTAICAIPTEVSRAMMRAWHSHNGVTLKNPRLGFVCTKQTVDGQPGLEGYFQEYDRDLEPHERLRFAPGEESPECDPAKCPTLDTATWPEERIRKALRNYAMEYVRNLLPEMVALFGPEEARNLGATTGRLIGMQYYDHIAKLLGPFERNPEGFAKLVSTLAEGMDDEIEVNQERATIRITQTTWRLMRGLHDLHPAVFEAWSGLFQGLAACHNRRMRFRCAKSATTSPVSIEWTLT